MWCVAELNPEYIEKMEDVLAVYEKPYNSAEPVVCIDEKPVTLHAEVRPPIPMAPGKIAKRDNEYERCGTANVFCAVEPKAGRPLHLADAEPLGTGIRPSSGKDCGPLSVRANDSHGHGQPEPSLPQDPHRLLR